MPTDDILLDCEEAMEKATTYLAQELRGIRTGRASVGLVDHIKVPYYGSPTDLRQLASIATPQPDMIVIKPFDPGSVKDIERAIQASELGITPATDGKVIRLPIPPLSMDRRKTLAAQIKKMAEAAKVTVRNARRDMNKQAEQEEKDNLMTEDEAEKCRAEIQKLTDEYGSRLDTLLDEKTKEIMES